MDQPQARPDASRSPNQGPTGRIEDARFLAGASAYIDDLPPSDALRAAFIRSPVAHATITDIDLSAVAASPGVVGAWSAGDLDLPDLKAARQHERLRRPVLARDRVRFVGEPVGVVVAHSLAQAQDAIEAAAVGYEPLEAVTDPEQALDDQAPLLFPEHGSNRVEQRTEPDGWVLDDAVLDDADVVISGRFVNQRVVPLPLEPNAALAVPDGDGLNLWVSTQVPFSVRDQVAAMLDLPGSALRVVAPDVGGAFGAKLLCYPEYVVLAALARRLERPLRWVDTRSETMLAMNHGRAHIQYVRLGATSQGRITGLQVRVVADGGAYPTPAGLAMPGNTYLMACGAYQIPRVAFQSDVAMTNTTPIAAYRGAGRPEATAMIERVVDMLASELGLDPVTVRRRNLIPADAFPHATCTGATYDSGDYEAALNAAIAHAGYDQLRHEQLRRRRAGERRLLGIGVATYVEVTGRVSAEHADVEVARDGAITVRTGISTHGQGHETAFSQLVTDLLGVPPETVRIVHSDTAAVASGRGTMGSRALQIGGSSVLQAGETVLAKAKQVLAAALEAPVSDIVVTQGGLGVAGSPETVRSWAQLAELAEDPANLPAGSEPGLRAGQVLEQPAPTFPSGTHVAVVEVDADTGFVRLLSHVAADDAGTILNHALADGQVHGGLAQGIAQALYEEMRYDELGNPLGATLVEYLAPGAADLPAFSTLRPQTPTPHNRLGAKGIGEAATIGSTPAVQNAVVDALSHLGVRHLDLPATPQRVWRALQQTPGQTGA